MSQRNDALTQLVTILAQHKMVFTDVAFADGTQFTETSQLCYIIGLLIYNVNKESPFHIL